MTHRFSLTVDRQPGALERVLGVARRRRLDLERLLVDAAADNTWNVSLTAAGAAPAEATLALRQFEGLLDVRRAAIEEG